MDDQRTPPASGNQGRLVVITGGPGSGKTALLELVRRHFHVRVAVLPEAASILFGGGFPRLSSETGRRCAQRAIFFVQRQLERMGQDEAAARLVLCDRARSTVWPIGPAPRRRTSPTSVARETPSSCATTPSFTSACRPTAMVTTTATPCASNRRRRRRSSTSVSRSPGEGTPAAMSSIAPVTSWRRWRAPSRSSANGSPLRAVKAMRNTPASGRRHDRWHEEKRDEQRQQSESRIPAHLGPAADPARPPAAEGSPGRNGRTGAVGQARGRGGRRLRAR